MSNLKNLQENINLSQYTTFQLGGPAEFFLEISEENELVEAIEWARNNNVDLHFIGGGSNLLVCDQGVSGLVLKLTNKTLQVRGERLECGAGLPLANAVSSATGHSLSGLEWSVGIPRATIGGAVRGNAGAFGSIISEIIETVRAYDTQKLVFTNFSKNDCDFTYRNSLFKEQSRYLIWSTVLKLTRKDIKDIKARMQEVIDFRFSRYPRLPSAGSVFENLTKEVVRNANLSLYERALADQAFRGEKIGAGYLIDLCGLKGKKIGGIKVSLEHANHIVNTGTGTAEEVVMLISYIKQQIRDRFGIELKEELQYLGFENIIR